MKKEALKLKSLSQRLVALHENIWILDTIKWDDRIKDSFFANGAKELPKLGDDYYNERSRRDYDRLQVAFVELALDIEKDLAPSNPLKQMLLERTQEFITVCDMLKNRGNKKFAVESKKLYGSSLDKFMGNKKLYQVSEQLLDKMRVSHLDELTPPEKKYSAKKAQKFIQSQMDFYLGEGSCNVKIADNIVSDAVAGADSIKLRESAKYSQQSMESLVVHEGLVHVATYKNGKAQDIAPFLSVGSPSVTATQEGLAVFMEVVNFHSYPERIKRICERMKAIHMAEQGADFLDVYRYFVEKEHVAEEAAYVLSARVFRGGDPKGGSFFTKDISYVKGLLSLTDFIDKAIDADKPEYLPALFHGKLRLRDIPSLVQAEEEKLITAPQYIPKPFNDVNGLYVYFSLFQSLFNYK